MPIERKLAAIMFTAIPDYSSISAQNEDKALQLLEKQNQALTPIIEQFGGILHKKLGDGLLITFSTITSAIKCAAEFQKKVQLIEKLDLCISIHEGEITFKDGDVLGNHVNISALMLRYSTVGGVVISDKVYHNISNLPEFEIAFLREEHFQGFSEKIKIYAITSHGFKYNPKDSIDKPGNDTLFIKTVLKRRIPQILGSYFITGTSLIFFIQYLVDKYQFPYHYPTLSLFALVGILPSVIILAYFHGAPGKDEWTKVEKVGVPLNVLFIAVILFFGDSLNLWDLKDIPEDTSPTISLIHFTTLPEHIPHYKKHLTLNPAYDLYPIENSLLDSLRGYFSVQVLNWYFGENKNFIIPKDKKEINYLNNYPLRSVDLDFTEERKDDVLALKNSADSIFNRFNNPDNILYLNIYKVSLANRQYKYMATWTGFYGNIVNNGANNPMVDSITALFVKIEDRIRDLLGAQKEIGLVSKINDDIIVVTLEDLNVRENMKVIGTSTYDYGPGKNGYNNRLDDLKNAVKYMREGNNDNYNADLESYNETYLSLLVDSLYCKHFQNGRHVDGCVQTRDLDYSLRVISVVDSIAVTKLIKRQYPWVQIRINDKVLVKTN